jgi:hypothetical protein
MRHVLIAVAISALVGSGGALAQSAAAPSVVVNVSVGPALQKKAADFGQRDLAEISDDLRNEVLSALKHPRSTPPVRVDLVIEDAVPNRPTFQQLGRTVGLSMHSVGLGGARISGVATYADGAQRPIQEQFFETDLREERGLATWSDADIAFDRVANDLRRGVLPAKYVGPGPTNSGHFGYPFTNQ